MGWKDRRDTRRSERKERRKRFGSGIKNFANSVVDGVKHTQSQVQSAVDNREERIVRRSERALVIFSEFNEHDDGVVGQKLYGFAEKQGVSLAAAILNRNYDRIFPVTGRNATLSTLVRTIDIALDDPDIDELDLFWHGHGQEYSGETLSYSYSMAPDAAHEKGMYTLTEICEAIEALNQDNRLRAFYSTACWGAELAEGMVDIAGFSCGSGARAVNTNAALEYPLFLNWWKSGRPFGTSVSNAMRRSLYQKIDREVAKIGPDHLKDTDSRKELFGDISTTIRSNADY